MDRAGERTYRIEFERAVLERLPGGQEKETFSLLGSTKAAIYWGSGSERRQAAQEGGVQAASFVCLATGLTRDVTVRDRISYGNGSWNIRSVVPRGRSEIEFNASRAI